MKHVLVVDDEEDLLELLQYNLKKEGYDVKMTTSGEDALTMARTNQPDLIVLDLMLPGLSGEDVCRILKNDQKTGHIPIIMLTAKGEDADILAGFSLGADDYIPKPFSPKVLIARIQAVLRRGAERPAAENESLCIHGITIHPGHHTVLIQGAKVTLTHTEFKLLWLLARRPGWVYTRYQIVDGVRGEEYSVTERAVDVQVVGLRKKLGEYGKYIETVRGVGYRMKDKSSSGKREEL